MQVVLEFHHKGRKDIVASQMVAGELSLERIQTEIAKCGAAIVTEG